nr:hypothetical protein [uncultured Noviherbaspirillum sp.]
MISPLLMAALSVNCPDQLDSRVPGQFIWSACGQCAELKGNDFVSQIAAAIRMKLALPEWGARQRWSRPFFLDRLARLATLHDAQPSMQAAPLEHFHGGLRQVRQFRAATVAVAVAVAVAFAVAFAFDVGPR